MSYISDFKTAAIGLFGQGYGPIPANSTSATVGTGALVPECFAQIGQKFTTADGRTLALVANGAVPLAAAKVVQSSAEITAFQKLAMTVPTAYPATAGATQILVTNGSTVLKQNLFAGGYAVVAAGTGIGQTLKISTHQAAANAATFVVTLEDAVITTLDATSKISLIANPYNGVLIQVASGSTQTGSPVGITLYPIAASTAATYDGTSGALTVAGVEQYGFIVTHGPTAGTITTGGTSLAIGNGMGISTTAGSLIVQTLTTAPLIAYNLQTQTDAQAGLVYLNL